MVFDFKKEYREFYLPKNKPAIITVPPLNYIAVRGEGDPNQEDGAYKKAINTLYSIAYTIKMSKRGNHRLEGYFDFVVPPLEGLWQQKCLNIFSPDHKELLQWISLIRLPDFVTEDECAWAIGEAARKGAEVAASAEFFSYDEGTCVQCMHIGAYDDEPSTIGSMHRYMEEQGYILDISSQRLHHEIYLSDARRVPEEKRRTVIRHPIKKV